jgi:hypothetical protein
VDVTSLAVVVAVLVGGISLVELIVRRTDVGAALVLSLLVVQEAANTNYIFGVGPFSVHANDLAMILLAGGAVARLLRTHRPGLPQRLLIGLGLLLLWSIARGVDLYGLTAAVNPSRKLLGFIAAALYFSTVEPRQDLLDRIVRFWLIAAAALSALAVLRWGAGAIGVSGGILGSAREGLRAAIPSDPALLVGQAALLSVPLLRHRSAGLLRYAAPLFLLVAILLQHRTVWVVVAAGLLLVLFRQGTLGIRAVAMLTVGLAVVAGVLFFALNVSGDPVVEELADSATRTDTFEWRVGGWEALLRDSGPETLEETVAGRPFGTGWERRFDGIVVNTSPHNFYLEVYLRLGVAGITLLLALYAVCLPQRRSRAGLPYSLGESSHGGSRIFSEAVLTSIVAVQLIYFIPYSPDMAQGLLLGIACALAMQHRREPLRREGGVRSATGRA